MRDGGSASRREVGVSLDEALVREARHYTDDLNGTLERLLGDFVARERTRHGDAGVSRVVAGWNAFHAEYGLLSDEFSAF